ncbi:MAG: alpha/beta hydrolase [Phycisphaerae bacterium]|nr:alpha/beta hydrolase [Phycisphaerae bacterium]
MQSRVLFSSRSVWTKLISMAACLLVIACAHSHAQAPNYGTNDEHGRYADAGDARIYYEVYGEGRPLVLLHGGFSYIDSFKEYIPILSKKFRVIAVATRGYGRSELGTRKHSYALLAEDVGAVLRKEVQEKVVLLGSSDGAMVAYLVAWKYPELVHKTVVMGGSLGTRGYAQEGLRWLENVKSADLAAYRPDLRKIMPEPQRWDEFMENLRAMWSEESVLSFEDVKKITCPVLMIVGDRDIYNRLENVVEIYRHLPNGQLAIMPNSKHIDVSPRNTAILETLIVRFLD